MQEDCGCSDGVCNDAFISATAGDFCICKRRCCGIQSQLTVSSRECNGWYESAYVEWQPVDGAKSYNVYIKGETEADSAYKKLDDELIRQYPDYWRADAPGLKAGKYMFKVKLLLTAQRQA